MNDILLGVNVDHIATIRQVRGTTYPNILKAAKIAEENGADSITVHLREDRRHIQDEDIWKLQKNIKTKLNLEIAVTEEMINIASELKPKDCCLVPEKRQELTTEGGLDVIGNYNKIKKAIDKLHDNQIRVSLFVDADNEQIQKAFDIGAKIIEIHTGHYADTKNKQDEARELYKIINSVKLASSLGLQVNAGHGLHYLNVQKITAIQEVVELNIGHSIIAQAIFDGLPKAVSNMKQTIINSRK